MRPVVPWSVKGIEPEARETAKQAARRAGMTLGAWLNHVILDQGTDDATATAALGQDFAGFTAAAAHPPLPGQPQASAQSAAYGAPYAQPPIDLSPVTDAVRDLVRRIDDNERHIEGSLETLVNRIETSEQLIASGAQPVDASLERKMQQLNERLETSERERQPFGRRPDDRIAFQGVENTLSAVVDHLETADNQSEQKFTEVRRLLSELSERVDSSDASTRAQQEQAKTDAFGNTLQNLSERMAEMEQSVHAVANGADQSRRLAVEEAVQAVSSKLDSDQQRSRVADLQNVIDGLATRIDRSETQSAQSIKGLEDSFSGFITRLEKSQVSAAEIVPQVMAQLDGRLEEVVSRVTDSETRALETASSVEQALSSLAQNVSTAEVRNADARETVQSMVAQVSERIEQLETGSRLPLSPTIAVSAGLAGMVPPPVSSAPPPPPGPLDGPVEGLDAMLRAPEPTAPPPPVSSPSIDAPSLGDLPPPAASPALPPMPGDLLLTPPPETAPPVLNEKKAARDFIAAARRAAQMSQPSRDASPGLGFGEPSTRYAAFEDNGESRGKRLAILIGGAVIALIVVLALVNWLAAPSNPERSATDAGIVGDEFSLDNTGIDGAGIDTPQVALLDATVPPTGEPSTPYPVTPEAIPEDAGTVDAVEVPASTPSAEAPRRAAPVPLPETRVPATAAPRSIVPNATDLPPVEAAPTTPVTRAPSTRTTRNALRSAAAAGNSAAQYEVGLRYAQGSGVPQDYDQAAYWFDLSAKQNLAIAQYRLATLFEKGRGVSQDQEQARNWYENAAQAGNVKAMHNLAVIYAEGKGVPQNFAKAGQWFLAAADHGLPDSQYNVAVLFERGLGLEEDLPVAYKWFSIAANNGDDGAGARRDAIADRLDATALVDAKLAAQTWGPRAADPIANGNLSSLGNWGSRSLSSSSSSPRVTQSDANVAQAQGLLRELGYQPGPPDGLMGPRTRDAIRDFQSKAGLDVSGSVDAKLLDTLKAYVR